MIDVKMPTDHAIQHIVAMARITCPTLRLVFKPFMGLCWFSVNWNNTRFELVR